MNWFGAIAFSIFFYFLFFFTFGFNQFQKCMSNFLFLVILAMACPFATERVWTEKARYHDAEKDYFEHLSKVKFYKIIILRTKIINILN